MSRLIGSLTLTLLFLMISVFTECQSVYPDFEKIVRNSDTALLRKVNSDIKKAIRANPDSAFILSNRALKTSEILGSKREVANSLNNIGISYYYLGEMDSSIIFNNKALDIFNEINDSIRYADVLINIGNVYFEKGDYPSARLNYEKSYTIYLKQKYIQGQAKAANNLANAFSYFGNYKQAIEYYFKAMQIEIEGKNPKGEAICCNNIGIMYHKLNKEQEALKYYNKACSIYKKLNDKLNIATTLNQIAVTYCSLHNNDTSLILLNQALIISEEIKYDGLIAVIKNNIGEVYLAESDYPKGLKHFETAYNINKTLGDEGGMSINLVGQGKILNKLGRFKEAVSKLQEAYKISTKINSIATISYASQELSIAYEELGNYKKALEFQKIFKSMSDSTLNMSNIENITALQMQFDFDILQKKQEFNRLKREMEYNGEIRKLKLKRLRVFYFSILLLVIITSAFTVFTSRQKVKISKLKIDLNNNMQRLLSQQMNPHFIFNTFKSIQNFLLKNDIKQSNFYLVQFSKLVRKNLENSQHEFITLKAEFEALELYMQIENLRLNNTFDFEIKIDESIDPNYLKIPSMFFQPFVENSIWHGVSKIEGRGLIKINVLPDKERIKCTIEDNGAGRRTKDTINPNGHQSLGTTITGKRIALLNMLYKTGISTNIIDLTDADNKPAGTLVEFYLPVVY